MTEEKAIKLMNRCNISIVDAERVNYKLSLNTVKSRINALLEGKGEAGQVGVVNKFLIHTEKDLIELLKGKDSTIISNVWELFRIECVKALDKKDHLQCGLYMWGF